MANGVSWIKLSIDIFNNKKIKQIRKLPEGDAIIGIWLQILCLAGSINDGGMVYFTQDLPYSDEMLSTEFDRPLPLMRLSLKTFVTFGMIEIVNDIMLVSNWEKYQNVDGLEKIRESGRNRQKKFREKQIAQSENLLENKDNVTLHNVSVTLQDNVTVTPSSISVSDTSNCTLNSKGTKVPSTKVKKESISLDTVISAFTENSAVIEAIQAYIEMRVKIKKEPTVRALQQVFKKLEPFDDGQKIIFLDTSTLHNWVDVYTDKTEQSKPFYQNKPTPNFLKPIPDYSQGESSFEQWAREDREKAEREKEAAK